MLKFVTFVIRVQNRFTIFHSTFSPCSPRLPDMISSIVTHPGGAHKDDFLACSVLLKENPVSIFRREPSTADLADPNVVVLDVGGEHATERRNFDHHQFPRDLVPTCALSLVLQYLELYEDAREFCPWLEVAEWFDCRGPKDTAEWLQMDRDTLGKLNSPIDITLLKNFARKTEHHPGEPIWEVMRMIGSDLVEFITTLRNRIDLVAQHVEVWVLTKGQVEFKALFLPRSDLLPEDASGVLGYHVVALGLEDEILALVSPDSRGAGYGMRRFNDDPRMDFTRVGDEQDVHFAHARGFIAKTSSDEVARLKALLLQSYLD